MKIPEIVEKYKQSIIFLAVNRPGENNQRKISIRGTGFIISEDGQFITCAHVYKQIPQDDLPFLEAAAPIMFDSKTKMTTYKADKIKSLFTDEENDLILMKIGDYQNGFVSVNAISDPEQVKEGDEIVFIGYPLATELLAMGFGITKSTNHGIISSVKRRGTDGSLHFFMIDTHVNNGSSGSPVILKETGEVIGVASGKIGQNLTLPDGKEFNIPANMGICRPINYANELLKKVAESKI